MVEAGKVGDSEGGGPVSPLSSELEKALGGGKKGEEVELHLKVRTLDDLKRVLIQHLGEKKGMKFYNDFLATIAMESLAQVRRAADQALQQEKSGG